MKQKSSDCQRGPVPDQKRAVSNTRVNTTEWVTRAENIAFEQDPEVQEHPLRTLIPQCSSAVVGPYSDRVSSTSDMRPGLQALSPDRRQNHETKY